MFVSLKTFQCPVCAHFYNKKYRMPNGLCVHCDNEMRKAKESPQLSLPL